MEREQEKEEERDVEESDLSGSSLEIVSVGSDGKLTLNKENLESIMKNLGEKSIAIISVCGLFRLGKSFLLNIFLHSLKCKSYGKERHSGWLEECWEEKFDGQFFPSESSAKVVTKGIRMWSKPILSKDSKSAVLLMDTQGLFDGFHKDASSRIFCLSSFVASLQIFNAEKHFNDSQAGYLEVFIEYAKTLLPRETGNEREKVFPVFVFLRRNWESIDYDCGFKGGWKYYLEEVKKAFPDMYEAVDACFKSVKCFLMPHPGRGIARASSFDKIGVKLIKDEPDFATNLEDFVDGLSSPSCIPFCKQGGILMTANDLVKKIEVAVDCLNEGKGLDSLVTATAKVQHADAVSAAHKQYKTKMEDLTGSVHNPTLEEEHENLKAEAISVFKNKPKAFQSRWASEYQQKLEGQIDETYHRLKAENEDKLLTAKLANQDAVEAAETEFVQSMSEINHSGDNDVPFQSEARMEEVQMNSRRAAQVVFQEKLSNNGGHELAVQYEETLLSNIQRRGSEIITIAKLTKENTEKGIAFTKRRLLECYQNAMTGRITSHLTDDNLNKFHKEEWRRQCEDFKRELPKKGGEVYRADHMEQFEREETELRQWSERLNDSKRSFLEQVTEALTKVAAAAGAVAVVAAVAVAAVAAVAVAARAVAARVRAARTAAGKVSGTVAGATVAGATVAGATVAGATVAGATVAGATVIAAAAVVGVVGVVIVVKKVRKWWRDRRTHQD